MKPNFFAAKDRGKGYYDSAKKDYAKHDTTMDYLQTVINSFRMSRENTKSRNFIPFSDLINDEGYNVRNVWVPKVDRVVKIIRASMAEVHNAYNAVEYSASEKKAISDRVREDTVEYVGNIAMTRNTMIYLLRNMESPKYSDVRRPIMNTLFGYPNTDFYNLIKSSAEPIPFLMEDPDGDLEFYGIHFKTAQNLDFSSNSTN